MSFGVSSRIVSSSRFGDTESGNYTEFESDGTIVFHGDATVWNDLNYPAAVLGKSVNAPDSESILVSGNLLGQAFAGTGTTVEQLFGAGELLHDWQQESTIEPHIHWMPSTADSGNVKWQLEYSIKNINGVFSAPTTISLVDAADGSAWKHQYMDFPDVTMTDVHIGSYIIFRVFRDPADIADTYEHDAILLAFGIHYKSDTVGSRTEASK